ncbi:hypothetical protein GOODEAATRI_000092 [Goodea atripinnis]|uniref:Uncharacterized protein n=1 Tax=Goodea atripinnis TaxID=208336 RepID=A0ABV0NGC7_9TELE
MHTKSSSHSKPHTHTHRHTHAARGMCVYRNILSAQTSSKQRNKVTHLTQQPKAEIIGALCIAPSKVAIDMRVYGGLVPQWAPERMRRLVQVCRRNRVGEGVRKGSWC